MQDLKPSKSQKKTLGKDSTLGLDDDFLDMRPKVQKTEAKINKRDYIKLLGKSFCMQNK